MAAYVWGMGPGMGLSEIKKIVHPTPLDAPALTGKVLVVAACGEQVGDFALRILSLQHTAVADNLGNLYTWGRNKDGQLGFSSQSRTAPPTKVEALR